MAHTAGCKTWRGTGMDFGIRDMSSVHAAAAAGCALPCDIIGHLMREGFDLRAAAAFYLLYGTGMVTFVILPARHVRDALLRGALFGLIAYATYDLTNQATLRDWPWRVTFTDLAWGAFVTGTSCLVAYLVVRRARRT